MESSGTPSRSCRCMTSTRRSTTTTITTARSSVSSSLPLRWCPMLLVFSSGSWCSRSACTMLCVACPWKKGYRSSSTGSARMSYLRRCRCSSSISPSLPSSSAPLQLSRRGEKSRPPSSLFWGRSSSSMASSAWHSSSSSSASPASSWLSSAGRSCALSRRC